MNGKTYLIIHNLKINGKKGGYVEAGEIDEARKIVKKYGIL